MARIKGERISLKVKTQTGEDSFGMPVYSEEWIDVDNVLVCKPTSSDIENALTHKGAKIVYSLCIPKGDKNEWFDTEVSLPGRGVFRTVGDVMEYTEANIPLALDWNRQVNLEQIEG
jgi:hypothetical protein